MVAVFQYQNMLSIQVLGEEVKNSLKIKCKYDIKHLKILVVLFLLQLLKRGLHFLDKM